MKNLGLLIVVAFLLTACDATPGGNKVILPVEHDEAVEHVDHHDGHDGHEAHNEDAHAADTHNVEKKDSVNKDSEEVDESPENAAH